MIHSIFIKNPDLLQFCEQTNIFSEVNSLLLQNTVESKKLAKEIILNTPFPQSFADKLCDDKTIIIGNGDVMNFDQGIDYAEKYGVDGIMIGRGIFKNPFAFLSQLDSQLVDTKKNRLIMLMEHTISWEKTWQSRADFVVNFPKHFPVLKKFVKMYINGFDNSAELRAKFMEQNSTQDMINLCKLELSKLG